MNKKPLAAILVSVISCILFLGVAMLMFSPIVEIKANLVVSSHIMDSSEVMRWWIGSVLVVIGLSLALGVLGYIIIVIDSTSP